MTKKEWEQREWQNKALASLGITPEDTEALRRISNTLRRWFELECGTDAGFIERNGENGDGKPFLVRDVFTVNAGGRSCHQRRISIPDREAGARKRLAVIMAKYPTLTPYIQSDPRGASLYILRPGDVPEGGEVDSYYTKGICVY